MQSLFLLNKKMISEHTEARMPSSDDSKCVDSVKFHLFNDNSSAIIAQRAESMSSLIR